jgi:hypothetical protein
MGNQQGEELAQTCRSLMSAVCSKLKTMHGCIGLATMSPREGGSDCNTTRLAGAPTDQVSAEGIASMSEFVESDRALIPSPLKQPGGRGAKYVAPCP